MAPIWVIGIDFSLVMAPLAITSILVFRSTQAFERFHEHHDSLTGLANRRAFMDQLNDALSTRTGAEPCALLMDLNGFKEINDRLGHEIGDALLVAFAERLERSLPAGIAPARLGGDEFAVLVQAGLDRGGGGLDRRLPQRTRRRSTSRASRSRSASASASPPHRRTDARAPTCCARLTSRCKAKRCRTPIEFYDNCVKSPQHGRLSLLSDLSDAPPTTNCTSTSNPSCAAVRRSGRHRGGADPLAAPRPWLDPAQRVHRRRRQTDLIGPITELVLRAATVGMITASAGDVKLAVNVSAQPAGPELRRRGLERARQIGLPAQPTRTRGHGAIVTNVERSKYTIGRLRQEGADRDDDFGVGYSSYQTLRLLDVDRVKIDCDFVANLTTEPRDRLIVASLIGLAHELGLDVVAGKSRTPPSGTRSPRSAATSRATASPVRWRFRIARLVSRWDDVRLDELVIANSRRRGTPGRAERRRARDCLLIDADADRNVAAMGDVLPALGCGRTSRPTSAQRSQPRSTPPVTRRSRARRHARSSAWRAPESATTCCWRTRRSTRFASRRWPRSGYR